MALVTYQTLADDVLTRRPPVTPRLIAVDGPSGAGKSTFAGNLARALGTVAIVEIDDFISWGDLESWWPRLEHQVLDPLLAGDTITYQQRDWDNDPLGNHLGAWRTLPVAPAVILEGVTSSRRAIADRLTLAVWVDAPPSLRLQRGTARDGDRMRNAWLDSMEREDAFFAQDGSRQRAHLLVDGAPTASHSPAHEFLCQPNGSPHRS